MTSSRPSASDADDADFDRLHPLVRRWVWRRGWRRLRLAQAAAIGPVLDGERDVIVAAPTAAGKTEAAFLPICSALLERTATAPGVEVLYVSPLKALINDQSGRLEELCDELGVRVHRWHGDVPNSRKLSLRKAPSGMLLITPESLEALFVRIGAAVGALLAGLRYVVVDELHAFIGTERGAQLQSLLHRVELVVGRRVPRIALSATLGELEVAAAFLRPGGAADTVLVEEGAGQELRLKVYAYESRAQADAKARIAGHVFASVRGTNSLVFANSRHDVEVYCDRLTTLAERAGVPSQFFPHHGNLSKELREHVEAGLKGTEQPVTAVCSSTLEMGIDIGDMDSVAQIGAPQSVVALRQRLGRSGRRGGPAILRLYAAESEITEKTPPADTIRAELVQSIATVRLLLHGWIEPPDTRALHLSTLVQQVLSLIAERGGVTAADAYAILCGDGPFQRVDQSMFAKLLRALGAAELIHQSADDTLLLDVAGERIVNHHSFFAAFTTPEEYRLVVSGQTLGTIPIEYPVVPGQLLIFAGRRWRVLTVDGRQKVIDLSRSPSGRPPGFVGAGPTVHDRIREEMYAIYTGRDVPSYVDTHARELLHEGRENFARLGLDRRIVVSAGDDTVLFPWIGDRTMGTLAVLLGAGGVEVSNEGVALTICSLQPFALAAELAVLLPGGPPDPLELAALVQNKQSEKHDRYLGEDLLNAEYAAKQLDPAGAWRVLERVARELDAGSAC